MTMAHLGDGMRNRPHHRHCVGVGIAAGIVTAVALAWLGVWGTATLAARGERGGTPTPERAAAVDTAHTATLGRHHSAWLPNQPSPTVTTTMRSASPVRDVATTASPAHDTCPLCTTVFTVPLPHDAHLDGVQWRNGPTSYEGWLDYYVAGRLVSRSGLTEDTPQPGDWDHPVGGACRPVAGAARCAVSYDTGAHSSAVLLLTAGPATGIRITDRVVGEGAGSWLTDLNADGLPDASVVEFTPRPDRVTAPRFWHTYVQHGGKLLSTGCSTPAVVLAPRPEHPETGACAR
jgi:hypothetical protein